MGEAIITRAGGESQNDQLPPVVVGVCQIVCTVKDSAGVIVPDAYVTCKDGSRWYNYHTNEKGKCLFVTNSGSANITAHNYSNQNNFKYIDIKDGSVLNVDAPVTTIKEVEIKLDRFQKREFYYAIPQISNNSEQYLFDGNKKFLFTKSIDSVIAVGGGGGGSGGGMRSGQSCGGGGGAANIGYNIPISTQVIYNNLIIGAGGSPGLPSETWNVYSNGGTGGTTVAFSVSAIGGGGATRNKYGVGSVGNYGGGGNGSMQVYYDDEVNNIINNMYGINGFGGGGGSYWDFQADNLGNPKYPNIAWSGANDGGIGGSSKRYDNGARYAYRPSGGSRGGGGGGCYSSEVTDTSWNNHYYESGGGGAGCIILNGLRDR